MHVPSSVFLATSRWKSLWPLFHLGEMEMSFDFCFGTMYVYCIDDVDPCHTYLGMFFTFLGVGPAIFNQ